MLGNKTDLAIKSSRISIWGQIDGANTDPVLIACNDLDPIEAPEGNATPVRVRNNNGDGWRVVAQLEAPPELVTTKLTTNMFKQRAFIEKLTRCKGNLFVLVSECGDIDLFNNWIRAQLLHQISRQGRTYTMPTQQNDAEVVATVAAAIQALEMFDADTLTLSRMALAEANAANGIQSNQNASCLDDCNIALHPGDYQIIVCDSAVAPAKGKVYVKRGYGVAFAATAADPGGAGLNLMSGSIVRMSANTYRLIVAQEGVLAAQGKVFYSDDWGATWTTTNVGGAAAGHSAVKGTGMFAPISRFVFLATLDGYIYKSTDGGEIFTAKESGVITGNDYKCIHFANEEYGVAGAIGDIIAVTSDGGETWTVATATGGGGDILCCQRLDRDHIWVGDDDGKLWYSNDGGATWTQRTGWSGSGTGDVQDIQFLNELQGFMLHNTAGPVGHLYMTIDGGANWKQLNTVTNVGMNQLAVADKDTLSIAGEVTAGTATILLGEVAYA